MDDDVAVITAVSTTTEQSGLGYVGVITDDSLGQREVRWFAGRHMKELQDAVTRRVLDRTHTGHSPNAGRDFPFLSTLAEDLVDDLLVCLQYAIPMALISSEAYERIILDGADDLRCASCAEGWSLKEDRPAGCEPRSHIAFGRCTHDGQVIRFG